MARHKAAAQKKLTDYLEASPEERLVQADIDAELVDRVKEKITADKAKGVKISMKGLITAGFKKYLEE